MTATPDTSTGRRPPKLDPQDVAKQLLEMPQKDFYKVVDQDTRGSSSPTYHAALRSEQIVVERWYQTLVAMKRSVEGTLAAKNSEAKARRIACLQVGDEAGALAVSGDHHTWRAGAIRFATGVSERLAEARFHRLRLYPQAVSAIAAAAVLERDQMAERYDMLLKAIRLHRSEILADADADPSEADETLWDRLPD